MGFVGGIAALKNKAVLIALMTIVFAVCVAAPAWSQDSSTDEGLRIKKAKGSPQGMKRAQAQAQANPAGPLAGQNAAATDDKDQDNFVDRLDIAVANCTVSEEGASITIQDEDGTQGLLVDDPDNPENNVDIIGRQGRVVVVGIPRGENLQAFYVNGGNGELFGNYTVVTSTGIRCGGESNGTVSGDNNGNGNGNNSNNGGNNGGGNGTGDNSCPGAKEIATVEGNGNKQTPVFNVPTSAFRVSYDLTATSDPGLIFFSVDVRTKGGGSVTTIDAEQPGQGSSFVNEGPGNFFLDILAANVQYKITVESCTAANNGNGGNNGGNVTSGDGNNVDKGTIPNKNLPDTGGENFLAAVLAVAMLASLAGFLTWVSRFRAE